MKNILKYSIFGLLLAIPFTPLIVPNILFFPFITGKAFFFRIIVGILLGLFLSLALIEPAYRPKKTPLSICLWIFGLIILVADIFSPNPSRAFWSNFERMEGFVAIAHLLIYFLVAGSFFKNKEDWNKFFFVSAGVSTFLVFYGFLQLSHEIVINQGGARVDGTLGNAAYFAIYLLFQISIFALLWWRNKGNVKGIAESVGGGALGFVFYYLWHIGLPNTEAGSFGIKISIFAGILSAILIFVRYFYKDQKIKSIISHLLFGSAILGNIILLYFTATRGTILGFIGGVSIASLYLALFNKENKILRKSGAIIFGSIVLIIVIFFSVKNIPAVKNDPVLGRFASISWNEAKDQARSYTWPMAIEGFKEKPILGWGQEGFVYIFNKYYNPLMWRHEPWFDRTHNAFLDWLVAGGLFGFFSYLSIFLSSLYLIWKRKGVEIFEKALLLGLLGGYTFNNIFVFDNLVSYIFFFSILAMLHSESVSEEKTEHKKDNEGEAMLATFFIILSLVAVYFVNIKPLMQNITLINALSVVGVQNNKVVSCTKNSFQKDASGKYQNVCTKTDFTLDLFKKAIGYNSLGTTEAREHFLRISNQINLEPRVPNAIKEEMANLVITEHQKQSVVAPFEARGLLIFGSYLRSVGLVDASIEYLEKARAESPKKQQILIELGSSYLDKGEKEKAYDLFKEAYEEAKNNPEAVAVYLISSYSFGKFEQADGLVKELVDLGVADQRVVNVLISVRGKNKALEYLNNVLKTDPENASAKELIASLSK